MNETAMVVNLVVFIMLFMALILCELLSPDYEQEIEDGETDDKFYR